MMRAKIAVGIAALTWMMCLPVIGDERPRQNMGLTPMTVAELKELQASLLFGEEDVRYLRMSRDVLAPQIDKLLDTWYGFVGSQPHLLASFSDPTNGKPNAEYLGKVRERFKAWVLTTAEARFDQAWLNRQLEYGLRHHRLKKNRTDNVRSSDHIAMRHLVALSYPVSATMRPFLENDGHSPEDVNGMHEAWRKAVLLTAILWSQPYTKDGDF